MTKVQLTGKQALLLKSCLNNPKLSWKAKGLYSYVVSLEDCNIKISNLISQFKGGRDSTLNAMKELKDNGYILTGQLRDPDNGQFSGYAYLAHRVTELARD